MLSVAMVLYLSLIHICVFCTNPSGEVATEYYENGLAVVNGHAYKSKDMKTNNTNFALLVSKNFTEPFKSPIEYGKHIAQLGNMLSDGKILLQRYGDFRRGRRTTEEQMCIRDRRCPWYRCFKKETDL